MSLDYESSLRLLIAYPGVRQNWFWYVQASEKYSDNLAAFISFLRSGLAVDQASIILFADALIKCRFYPDWIRPYQLSDILEELSRADYYYQYAKNLMLWRFGDEGRLFESLSNIDPAFQNDHFFGRLAGGMYPRFAHGPLQLEYLSLPIIRRNQSAQGVIGFIDKVASMTKLPSSIRPILFSPNGRRSRNRTTPQKFNLLLALAKSGRLRDLDRLIEVHDFALTDVYYREVWREAGLSSVQVRDHLVDG